MKENGRERTNRKESTMIEEGGVGKKLAGAGARRQEQWKQGQGGRGRGRGRGENDRNEEKLTHNRAQGF